jgi:hypothetical protein
MSSFKDPLSEPMPIEMSLRETTPAQALETPSNRPLSSTSGPGRGDAEVYVLFLLRCILHPADDRQGELDTSSSHSQLLQRMRRDLQYLEDGVHSLASNVRESLVPQLLATLILMDGRVPGSVFEKDRMPSDEIALYAHIIQQWMNSLYGKERLTLHVLQT